MKRTILNPTVFALALSLVSLKAMASLDQVSLTAYSDSQSYASSAFNFEKMSQDPAVTGNRFHILYEPDNFIRTATVVGDLGLIADLGETSCKQIANNYETQGQYPGQGHGGYPYKEDRVLDPMFWLTYSSAWNVLQELGKPQIAPVVGHCYLEYLTGHDGIVVAMFHVKDLVSGKMLVIDEIELFQRAEFKRN